MKFGRSDYDKRIIDTENKIPENEPVFFLRAKDKFAPELLLLWAMKLRLAGGDPELAENAEKHAQDMINWQSVHGSKLPDMTDPDKIRKALKLKIDDLLLSCDTSNIRSLQETINKYFDSPGDHLLVLMEHDLLPEVRNELSLSDPENLELNLDMFQFEFEKTDLELFDFIIYVNKYRFYVLKTWK